jgi:hypothetical protein
MPSGPNFLPKARWHLGAVAYPDVAIVAHLSIRDARNTKGTRGTPE